MNNTHYKELSEVSYKEQAEKKNGLDYLTWSKCWHFLKQKDETAVCRRLPVEFYPNGTAMVAVEVTALGITNQMWLPVMEQKPRERISAVKDPNAFQINTAYMRCLAKCIALFGIGLDLYNGEDLPESSTEPKYPDMGELATRINKTPPTADFKALYGELYSALKPEDQKVMEGLIKARRQLAIRALGGEHQATPAHIIPKITSLTDMAEDIPE